MGGSACVCAGGQSDLSGESQLHSRTCQPSDLSSFLFKFRNKALKGSKKEWLRIKHILLRKAPSRHSVKPNVTFPHKSLPGVLRDHVIALRKICGDFSIRCQSEHSIFHISVSLNPSSCTLKMEHRQTKGKTLVLDVGLSSGHF